MSGIYGASVDWAPAIAEAKAAAIAAGFLASNTRNNVTASMALGVNYTNTTGRLKLVVFVAQVTAATWNNAIITVDGIELAYQSASPGVGSGIFVLALVPAGSVYVLSCVNAQIRSVWEYV